MVIGTFSGEITLQFSYLLPSQQEQFLKERTCSSWRSFIPLRGVSILAGPRTFVSPSAYSRRAVVSYWQMYVHKVLVNRLGGLSLPRKSVVRLTDHPDMTLDVHRGRKTTAQQQQVSILEGFFCPWKKTESQNIVSFVKTAEKDLLVWIAQTQTKLQIRSNRDNLGIISHICL